MILQKYFVLINVLTVVNGYFPAMTNAKDWWETAVFYQIYPRSFMDSDGDGIGDLKGITSKLEYLKDTGIDATWISPIFESPMVDFGYDISNFKEIHHEYGTMKDFEDMLSEAKKLNIKIILDFVPNHTSDKNIWFQNSVNRVPGYENFYVWHNGICGACGSRPLPPNNWVSVFYGSAWEWNDLRQQYYLHQFTKEQPDLNYREPKVVDEMKNVMLFWLDKGVDGFRIDAINHLFEDEQFLDEPESGTTTDAKSFNFVEHIYTKDQPESYEMVYAWRKMFDGYKQEMGGRTRLMMTEAYANMSCVMKYYESDDIMKIGSQMPFNFLLITDLNALSDARDHVSTINKWLNYMPMGKTPHWMLGNHDNSRVATRCGNERVDALNMVLMTLPGVPITYNGEEIGMIDHDNIPWCLTKDPAALNTNIDVYKKFSRDPERTPYQWNSGHMAGFTTGPTTWLPVNKKYMKINLKAQIEMDRSHYHLYKHLIRLRKHETFISGSFRSLAFNRNVFGFIRELRGFDKFFTIVNLGRESTTINLKLLDETVNKVVIVATGTSSMYNQGENFENHLIILGPFECLVLQSMYESKSRYFEEFSINVLINDVTPIGVMFGILYDGFAKISHGYFK